jgi:hypothetical protein
MKVITPGQLVFIPGRSVIVHGWHLQMTPTETFDPHTKAGRRAQLLAALAHIAQISGVDLAPETVTPAPERVLRLWHRQDIDTERQAANVITKARQGTKGKA